MKSSWVVVLLAVLAVPVLSMAHYGMSQRWAASGRSAAAAAEGDGLQVGIGPLAGSRASADGHLWGLVHAQAAQPGGSGKVAESPMLAEWIVNRSTTTVSPSLSNAASAWSQGPLSWSSPPAGQVGKPLLAPIALPQAPPVLQIAQADPVLLIPGDGGDPPVAPPLQREDSSTVPLPGTVWFLAPALGALTLFRKPRLK